VHKALDIKLVKSRCD